VVLVLLTRFGLSWFGNLVNMFSGKFRVPRYGWNRPISRGQGRSFVIGRPIDEAI
jgi:hypothetical protein